MATSSQKFIARNRAPRVQIEYDVELYGAERVQLFVMGVLSDRQASRRHSRHRRSPIPRIDVDNFDARMKAMSTRRVQVPAATGEGNLAVDITFEHGRFLARPWREVQGLKRLLEARRSSPTSSPRGRQDRRQELIAKVIKDPALLKSLADARKTNTPEQ
jgi:type VI secretion system protein ImpB